MNSEYQRYTMTVQDDDKLIIKLKHLAEEALATNDCQAHLRYTEFYNCVCEYFDSQDYSSKSMVAIITAAYINAYVEIVNKHNRISLTNETIKEFLEKGD